MSAAFADLAGTPSLLDLGRWDRCDEIIGYYFDHDAADLAAHVPTVGYAVAATWLFLWRGRLDLARRLVADADALFGRTGSSSSVAADLRALLEAARAGIANAEKRHEDAIEAARKSLAISLPSYPTMARRALCEAVEALFALGLEADVADLIEQASSHFSAGSQPTVDAHILRWKARLDVRRSGEDSAHTLRKAIDSYERLGRPFWLAIARMDLWEWLASRGRDEEGRVQLEHARSTFMDLGAEPWLHRAELALRPYPPMTERVSAGP